MEKKTDVLTVYVSGKIEEHRERVGMTQDDLALKVGLSRPSLVNMANGRQSVSIKRLFAIAEVLKIEPSELMPDLEWYLEHKGKKLRKVVTYEILD